MKKIIILGLIIVFLYIPFSTGGSGEYFNRWTGEIVCNENCWHEVGHKIDQQGGWISQGEEYKKAVEGIIDKDKPLHLVYLFNREFGLYAELYAEMLNMVNGDINKLPVGLQQFYNKDLANMIMSDVLKTN